MSKRLYPKRKKKRYIIPSEELVIVCVRCRRGKMRAGYLYCNDCLGLGIKKPNHLLPRG